MNNLAIIRDANEKIFKNSETGNLHNEGIIFVYTPPKVGSTSLVSSLRISLLKYYSILHIHDETMLKVLTGIDNIKIIDLINYNASIGKKVYVIDIYRTPIERKMSEYFEKLSAYHFNNTVEKIKNYKIELIALRFNNLFPHLGLEDYYFEKYAITPPGDFDFKNKYIYQKINNINYIKLRLNDHNEWGSILTNIIGKEVYVISDYKTEDKEIGELYKRFKEYYKLPKNYWEEIEKSKSLKYYLTSQEILDYKKLWCNKLCENHIGYDDKEYKIYMNISIENSIYDIVDNNHYIDEGCKCVLCSKARDDLKTFLKEKKKINIKIKHCEVKPHNNLRTINELKERNNKKCIQKIGKKIIINEMSKMSIITYKK